MGSEITTFNKNDDLWAVEILQTIFRIGIILGIFSFLWAFIKFLLFLVLPFLGRIDQSAYALRAIQSIFIIQTTLLFCYESKSRLALNDSSIYITALILLLYFLSKLQRRKNQMVLFNMFQNGKKLTVENFNLNTEIGLICLSGGFFAVSIFKPELAFNPITLWFQRTIIGLETAPIFGFIFQVVGFFFVVSILAKFVQSILFLLQPRNPKDNTKDDNPNRFDDFEEIKE